MIFIKIFIIFTDDQLFSFADNPPFSPTYHIKIWIKLPFFQSMFPLIISFGLQKSEHFLNSEYLRYIYRWCKFFGRL